MLSGRLKYLVEFQAEKRSDALADGAGGYALEWIPIGTVYGELRLERGAERLAAGRLESSHLGTLKVRSCDLTRNITAENRCIINGQPFQIRSNNNFDPAVCEMVVEQGVGT